MHSYDMHPLCTAFPLMNSNQFSALVADIRENGLLEPITLYEGKILDGRNRYTACVVNLGIDPEFVEYKGEDPLAFVISRNLSRRHLDESQRAMIAAKLANMTREDTLNQGPRSANLQNGKVSQSDAAKMLNVSQRTVASAKAVVEDGIPDLVEAVEQGEMSVSLASLIATLPEKDQHEVLAEPDKKKAAQKKRQQVKPKPTGLDNLLKAWRKANSDERVEFLEAIGVRSFAGIEL